jgi:outer membrane protein assembly factor BamE
MPRTAYKPLTASLLALAALAGCSSLQSSDNFLGVITPYRVEIVQGNVVTKEQVAAVKPGMTRTEVRDALGSPLLTDIFHADRWDYVFTIKRPGTQPQERGFTLQEHALSLYGVCSKTNCPHRPK